MLSNERPLVSVIVPYYNGRKHIREALESVLGQTYDNVEIVVVDDASPDKQDSEYIKKLSKEIGFQLIRHESNKGIGQTLADAVEVCSGEYIAELSQDDLYMPDKIERQVCELRTKNLDAVYVGGDVMYAQSGKVMKRDLGKTKKTVDSGAAFGMLKLKNLSGISIQGLLAKRSVFQDDIIGIWRDYLLDDWPVNIRLFDKYKVGFIDESLWRLRIHDSNTSHNIWKWLGPQIEVVARMAGEDHRVERIGDRVASMARRLRKQNGDVDATVRFAFAGMVLTDLPQQQIKVRRVLNKISSRHKRAIAKSKCRILEDAIKCKSEKPISEKTGNISWEGLGKALSCAVADFQGRDRLNEISQVFFEFAKYVYSSNQSSPDCAVRFALAALMLTSDSNDERKVTQFVEVVSQKNCEIIENKRKAIRSGCRRTIRSLWLN
ncbi:MAG: glycosyltransferase family 2 protein [Planctomycetes bacterium]|nr:glycosyltransferase family 2 protein [Planctomycetota bacterium]